MLETLRQIDKIFRPWPIRPLPMAVFLTLFQLLVNFAVLIAIARAQGQFVTPEALLATLPSLVLAFGFALLSLWGLKVLGQRKPRFTSLIYFIAPFLFGLAMAAARKLSTNDYTPDYWRDPSSLVRVFGISILLFLTVHVTLGVTSLRLQEQVRQAQVAKATLEIQRGKLISAQEDVRRQIADFLHDKLQSDLVLLGMQMQRSVEKLGAEERSIAQAYIDEIERIRQFDVRNVARQLVPELSGLSLKPALDDLFSRYAKVFKVSLSIVETGELSATEKLASYRIIEQALLNAAKHADPKNVDVRVSESETAIEVVVRNDGKPLPAEPNAGAGFAIIDEWVRQFQGDWSISTKAGFTELRVMLTRL